MMDDSSSSSSSGGREFLLATINTMIQVEAKEERARTARRLQVSNG